MRSNEIEIRIFRTVTDLVAARKRYMARIASQLTQTRAPVFQFQTWIRRTVMLWSNKIAPNQAPWT